MSPLDEAIALILQDTPSYALRELLRAGRDEQRDSMGVSGRWFPGRLDRYLADRAEIELGAREAIRAGSEACPLRDEPLEAPHA